MSAGHFSRTALLTPRDLSEGEPATLRVTYPHGKSTRLIEVPLSLDDCLVLLANAADAVALLTRATQQETP